MPVSERYGLAVTAFAARRIDIYHRRDVGLKFQRVVTFYLS